MSENDVQMKLKCAAANIISNLHFSNKKDNN